MSNKIEIILVCADGSEEKYLAEKTSEILNAGIIVWNDTRLHPRQRLFIFDCDETRKRHWLKPIFKEVKAYYIQPSWAQKTCNVVGCNFHKVGWHSHDS